MAPMLELKNLHYSYGAIHVLKGISLYVNEGETVALIGSNVVLATLYLAGATVTDWAKLAAAARGLRGGGGELPADQQVRR